MLAIRIDEPEHRQQVAGVRGDVLECSLIRVHEPRLQNEIFRRVTGEGELWKHEDLGPPLCALPNRRDRARSISVDVTNGEVQLAQSYPNHYFIL